MIASMRDDESGMAAVRFVLKGRPCKVRMSFKGYEELLRKARSAGSSRGGRPAQEQARLAAWSAIPVVVKGALPP